MLHRGASGQILAWAWQRDTRNGLREDEWTWSFAARVLAPTLEAAGATVLMLRERDPSDVGAWVDDADAGFHVDGSASFEPASQSWGTGARRLDDTAHAVWEVPPLPAGSYRVYARWVSTPSHAAEARYTVTSRSRTDVWTVDQRLHGGVWWPIGEVALDDGESAHIRLDGSGGTLSADAVRVGGGRDAPPSQSAAPFFELAPIHRQASLGGPPWLQWLDAGEQSSDIRFRARWSSWLSAGGEEAVYLSIHTNAGHGHGTELYTGVESAPPMPRQPVSEALGESLFAALGPATAAVASGWRVAPPRDGDFSEISPRWQQLPSALVEVGFHDSASDAARLRDPAFCNAFAEGLRDGIIRWRMQRGGQAERQEGPPGPDAETLFPPEPPPGPPDDVGESVDE